MKGEKSLKKKRTIEGEGSQRGYQSLKIKFKEKNCNFLKFTLIVKWYILKV